MPISSLYGDVITVTLSQRELHALIDNGELLLPGDGLPAPSMIRIVQEGHHEAHKSDPTTMYHRGYHADAQAPAMRAAFQAIAEELVKESNLPVIEFRAPRALDLGCSAGMLTESLRSLGVAAWGVDGSREAQNVNQNVLVHDLRKKDGIPWEPGTFDLVTSFDTAEHIEFDRVHVIAELAAEAVRPGGWVVFGAATPGQGGLGHVTLRSHAWWRERLAAIGLLFDQERTDRLRASIKARPESDAAWWVSANLQCFRGRFVW
mgnify:CR=1 FL=1